MWPSLRIVCNANFRKCQNQNCGTLLPGDPPVVPDDEGGARGEGDGLAVTVYLHPQDRVLCRPQHRAVHVDGRAPVVIL